MKSHPPFQIAKRWQEATPAINVVPLVDVLLVLLVVVLVTAPTLFYAVRTELPRAPAQVNALPRETILLTLTETGEILWNGEPIDRGVAVARLAKATAEQGTPPAVAIAVHRTLPFEPVAQMLAELTQAGVADVRFLLAPQKR